MSKKRTVFLVGAGALQNSWSSIEFALKQKYINRAIPTDPNIVFADLIFRLRWLAYNRDNIENSEERRLECRNAFTNDFEFYHELKVLIAERMKEAQSLGNLRLNPEIEKIKNSYLDVETTIITTNWDTTLDNYFESSKNKIIHLHGSIKDVDTLYFPSEITQEPYRDNQSMTNLMNAHREYVCCLEKADTIIIYGLSFSPLDAELNLIVGDSFRGLGIKSRKVVIIDTSPGVVIERFKFLSGMTDQVVALKPHEIS